MVDFTDGYTITSDGIDIGRDGNAVPWSRTPWNSSTDFERSTRNLVQTTTVGGRTFEVYAEPDRLGRGPKGLNYDVVPADGGEKPGAFRAVMTTREQVRNSIREYVEDVRRGEDDTKQKTQTLDNGWEVWTYVNEDGEQRWYVKTAENEFLQPGGSKSSDRHNYTSQSAVQDAIRQGTGGRERTEQKAQTLENGWGIWTYTTTGGKQRWYVRTDTSDATSPDVLTYLQPDGSKSSNFHAFKTRSAMESAISQGTDTPQGSLGYGWQIVETPDAKFYVVGRKEDGKVYLEDDGSTVSKKTTYASKSKARRAFRRWRDENVGDVRQKNNEARLEQSERFREAIEQRRQRDQTSPTVEVSRDREESMSDGVKEIENFGNGWKLVESPNTAAGDPNMIGATVIEWYVRRQTAGGFRYINREGKSTTSKTAFSSKKKARKAYQRWKNDNSVDSTGSSSVSTQPTTGGAEVSVTTTRGSGGGGGGSTGSVVVDRQPSFSGGVSGGSVSVPDETNSTSGIPTVALAAGAVVVLFMLR